MSQKNKGMAFKEEQLRFSSGLHTDIYIHLNTHICVCVCSCTYIYTYMHTHTYRETDRYREREMYKPTSPITKVSLLLTPTWAYSFTKHHFKGLVRNVVSLHLLLSRLNAGPLPESPDKVPGRNSSDNVQMVSLP